MAEAEARAAARRKLGNAALAREEIYRMNTISFLDALAGDVRQGLRALWRNPSFTTAVLACCVPAQRAATANPLEALRAE